MLKGNPNILSPELLKVLCEMGHRDRIVIANANFPVESIGKDTNVIHIYDHGVPEILQAILQVMPLDMCTKKTVYLMQLMDCDIGVVSTKIWNKFRRIVKKHDERGEKTIDYIDRFDFYDEAKKAYCIIITGETAVYSNIMLQKGVVTD